MIFIIELKEIEYFFTHNENPSIKNITEFISNIFSVDITLDQDIISGFSRDWSNIPGQADMLARPINENFDTYAPGTKSLKGPLNLP